MITLFGFLLISVAFLIFSLRLAGKKPTPVKNETETVSAEEFWKETTGLLEKFRLAELPAYYHPTKRDPMKPTGGGPVQPFKLMVKMTPYSLTGIMVGPERAAAIIDEKIYRVGNNIDDKTVAAIEKRQVILKKGMTEEILRLKN